MQLSLFPNEFPRVQVEPNEHDNNMDASIAYREKMEQDAERMRRYISGFLYEAAARSFERNRRMWQRYGGY